MTWSPEGVLKVTLKAMALTAPARAGRRAADEGLAATRAPAMREVERRASDIASVKVRVGVRKRRSCELLTVRIEGKATCEMEGKRRGFFFFFTGAAAAIH